jgi:hypothetical protein
MQQVRQLKPASPQIQRFIGKGGVTPGQAQRQDGLDGEQ